MHRRPRKIRRTGRHTTPSQVEKVAEKAGKAAPAVAIAGALVAGPATSAATAAPAKATTATVQVHQSVLDDPDGQAPPASKKHSAYHGPASLHYVVQGGDTLAGIAQKFYGDYNDWTWIYQANKAVIANPNNIYVGERLQIPASAHTEAQAPHAAQGSPAHGSQAARASHRAKHAKPAAAATTAQASTAIPHGTLGCSGLEQLWEDAGGAPGAARMAADIAMAESGGNQYAYSPTNDRGYWQINGSWGPLSTFDALGNAKAAVHISSDGTNWSPWTTYTSGAYYGRC